jgi:hypothetical protein
LSFIKEGEILLANTVILEENALKMIRGDLLRPSDQILGVYYEFVSL